jgi:hypothetical protein
VERGREKEEKEPEELIALGGLLSYLLSLRRLCSESHERFESVNVVGERLQLGKNLHKNRTNGDDHNNSGNCSNSGEKADHTRITVRSPFSKTVDLVLQVYADHQD